MFFWFLFYHSGLRNTDEITRAREQHGDDWQQHLEQQYEGRFYERLQEAWGNEWSTRLDLVLQGNNDGWLIEQIRNESYTLQAGNKRYELTNHLGNVLAVVSDKKEQSDGVSWSAIVVSAQDYFPFGMTMPGRSTDAKHRYTFNGKETDPETGIQDYGMRWYLPNIARFPSVDPLFRDYPWNSVYAFAENDVIRAIDLDGGEKKIVTYGIKTTNGYDNGFMRSCGEGGAHKMGVTAQGINTGQEFLSILKNETSIIGQKLSVMIHYGHSWQDGLFLNWDAGFYRQNKKEKGASGNMEQFNQQASEGQIKLSPHTLFIFVSCGTAGNGQGGHGNTQSSFSEDSFAGTFADQVKADLPEAEYTTHYKITTIGATDLSNLTNIVKNGTVTTDGTFMQVEKLYKVERKKVAYQVTKKWAFFSWTTTQYKWEDRVTCVEKKITNLGKKIDPTAIAKKHNDQDISIQK